MIVSKQLPTTASAENNECGEMNAKEGAQYDWWGAVEGREY